MIYPKSGQDTPHQNRPQKTVQLLKNVLQETDCQLFKQADKRYLHKPVPFQCKVSLNISDLKTIYGCAKIKFVHVYTENNKQLIFFTIINSYSAFRNIYRNNKCFKLQYPQPGSECPLHSQRTKAVKADSSTNGRKIPQEAKGLSRYYYMDHTSIY